MDKKRNILVVDDVLTNRRILSKILNNEGFGTLEAENGKEALDILSNPKNRIALVLLDIIMPVMDGTELLKIMKKSETLTTIPVIVTTGSEQSDVEVRSLEYGATDFITKPYNADVVCHRVKSILRLCDNIALINKIEIDRLTEVYNRESFYRHARKYMSKHSDKKLDIVCSNIENFKVINSKYGTAVGDELLYNIAKKYKELVGENGVCGRLGDDNFAILMPRYKVYSQEEAGNIIRKIFSGLSISNLIIQYGIYHVEEPGVSISEMCNYAQLAISSIKHKYGISYAVYDDSMSEKILRNHQLSDYMEQALKEKQFHVYLQPKHCIKTGEISGAEALVRWIHPELGFISPGEFIPLFENNGFIAKLDQYMWDAVCGIIQRWIKEGRKLIPISVNVSRVDFLQDNLVDKIMEMVDSRDIPHQYIHFEVTESAYTGNPKQIIDAVSILRAMDFLIEMDDFGSGYSSLNMLSELPIDLIKLDMRFLQSDSDVLEDRKKSILSFIVSLSKWLQLPSIAEGVENVEEVELLKTMGCDYIQGYYFSKPLPVSDFEDYMGKCFSENTYIEEKDDDSIKIADEADDKDKPLVLIVDDIASNREIIRECIKPYYRTLEACNGDEAHTLITSHIDELSCITLDLMMPVTDGFHLLNMMKQDGSLDRIPVIITSERSVDSELRAIHLGGYSFVAKPYNAEVLIQHVGKAVNEWKFRQMTNEK